MAAPEQTTNPQPQSEQPMSLYEWVLAQFLQDEVEKQKATTSNVGAAVSQPQGGSLADLLGMGGGGETGAQFGYSGYGPGGYGTAPSPSSVYGSAPGGYLADKAKGLALGGLQGLAKSAIMGTDFNPMSMVSPQGIVSDLAGMYGKANFQPGYKSTISDLLGSFTDKLGLGKTIGGMLQGIPSMALGMVPGLGSFANLGMGLIDTVAGTVAGKPATNWGSFLGNAALPAALGMVAGPVGAMAGAAFGPMAAYGVNQALHAVGLSEDPGLWGVDPETGLMNSATKGYYDMAVSIENSQPGTLGGWAFGKMVDAYTPAASLEKALAEYTTKTPEQKGWGSWSEIGAKTGDRGLAGSGGLGAGIGGETPSYGGGLGEAAGGMGDPGGSIGADTGTESYGGDLGNEARGEGDW